MRLLAALLSVVVFAGCATPSERSVTIPLVPAWVFADDSKVFTYVYTNGADAFGALFAEFKAESTYQLETTDDSYITVDYAWLEQLNDWAAAFQFAIGLKGIVDGFDCEKFSLGYAFAANISVARERIAHQPLLLRVFVTQVFPFGGVAATGGNHSVVAAFTNKGVFIVEPQTRVMVRFKDYPNRKTIYLVRIGG